MKETHRTLPGFLVVVLVPAAVLIDLMIALLRGWRSDSQLDGLIVLAAIFALFAALILVLTSFGRRFLRERAAHLQLSIGTAAAAWILVDCVLGIWFTSPRDYHIRRPNLCVINRPRADVMPGVFGESVYSTNSRGIRGPEFPLDRSIHRVLCIGGSSTECFYLDDRETWSALAAQWINETAGRETIWMGDVGMSGFAAPHHLRFLRESDLVAEADGVVMLVGMNDFHWYLQGGTAPEPPGPLWSRSPILTRVRAARRQSPTIVVEDEAGAAYTERRFRRQAMPTISQLPPIDRALAEYQSNLEAIVHHCRSRGRSLVFLTQPVLWSSNLAPASQSLLWMGWTAEDRAVTPSALREGMDRFNSVLIAVSRRLNIPCVDLQDMSGNEAYFYDDCHFTEAGAREVALRLARHLGRSGG